MPNRLQIMNLLVSTYEAAVEQNQQLRQAQKELKAQAQILAGINRVFREALTSETEEALGRICLATAEELTGSQFGFIGEINQAGLLEDIAISAPDMAACRMPGLNQPVLPKAWHMRGIFGKAVKDKQSVIANDPPSHPDRVGLPAGHPPLTAFLGVPLTQGGKTIGLLGLGNKPGGITVPIRKLRKHWRWPLPNPSCGSGQSWRCAKPGKSLNKGWQRGPWI